MFEMYMNMLRQEGCWYFHFKNKNTQSSSSGTINLHHICAFVYQCTTLILDQSYIDIHDYEYATWNFGFMYYNNNYEQSLASVPGLPHLRVRFNCMGRISCVWTCNSLSLSYSHQLPFPATAAPAHCHH